MGLTKRLRKERGIGGDDICDSNAAGAKRVRPDSGRAGDDEGCDEGCECDIVYFPNQQTYFINGLRVEGCLRSREIDTGSGHISNVLGSFEKCQSRRSIEKSK